MIYTNSPMISSHCGCTISDTSINTLTLSSTFSSVSTSGSTRKISCETIIIIIFIQFIQRV